MRIAFDARMITHPGIGRYTRNILSAMIHGISGLDITLYGNPSELTSFDRCNICEYLKPIYGIGEFFRDPFGKDEYDLVHIPHFNAPFGIGLHSVVTIHDLIYTKFKESAPFHKRAAANFAIRNAAKKACRVIAVSENTKQDLIRDFGILEEKIGVVHEAADPIFKKIDDVIKKEEVRKKYNLPDDFILFVGSLKKHKNLERLIDAYIDLKANGIMHSLVVVGKFNPRESDILNKILKSDAIYLKEVPEEDLVVLYNLACLFVLPSIYEGFGLPVLEAMICGVPVACSNIASLPEVVGDAAKRFDPYDVESIAFAINELLTIETLRNELIEKGLDRAAKFSWAKAAQQTYEVYEKVVGALPAGRQGPSGREI
ncbi:glycosyltransferase family 4 protein [Candidatus Omnitrophota bacterium]